MEEIVGDESSRLSRVREILGKLPRPNVIPFVRNVTILLLTVFASFSVGAAYGSWKTATTIYHHGPEIAGVLMDTSMRLWGFHRDPDVWQWDIKATGAWAEDWDEVSNLMEITNKSGQVEVQHKNPGKRGKG
jgi:hypothetical protein